MKPSSTIDNNDLLFAYAISRKDFYLADKLLNSGANINYAEVNGITVIMYAVLGGHLDVLNYLLSKEKIEINSPDKEGKTPVIAAILSKKMECLEALLKKGADPNAPGIDINTGDKNITPLYFAVITGSNEYASILIKYGANTEIKYDKRKTAIMFAASNGFLSLVKLLTLNGAVLDARDEDGMTALMHAATKKHQKILKYLLAEGANIDFKNNYEYTALSIALQNKDIASLRTLLNYGADESIGNTDMIVIISLAKSGFSDEIKLFYSATTSWKKITGQELSQATNSFISDENYNQDIAKAYLQARKFKIFYKTLENIPLTKDENCYIHSNDISIESFENKQPILFYAIKKENINILKQLIFNLDLVDKNVELAIVVAAKLGKKKIVEEMLKLGADVSKINFNHFAELKDSQNIDHIEIVQLIKGIMYFSKAIIGEQPLTEAERLLLEEQKLKNPNIFENFVTSRNAEITNKLILNGHIKSEEQKFLDNSLNEEYTFKTFENVIDNRNPIIETKEFTVSDKFKPLTPTEDYQEFLLAKVKKIVNSIENEKPSSNSFKISATGEHIMGMGFGMLIVNPLLRCISDKLDKDDDDKTCYEHFSDILTYNFFNHVTTSVIIPLLTEYSFHYLGFTMDINSHYNYFPSNIAAMVTDRPFFQGLIQATFFEGAMLAIEIAGEIIYGT